MTDEQNIRVAIAALLTAAHIIKGNSAPAEYALRDADRLMAELDKPRPVV